MLSAALENGKILHLDSNHGTESTSLIHTPNGHVHLEYVSLRTSFFDTFYKINCVTIHHSSCLLSKLGPKARTETRTKGPQSPKARKARKCQDRANNNDLPYLPAAAW